MSRNIDEFPNRPERAHLLAQMGDFPLKVDTIALAPDGASLAVAAAGLGIGIWDLESSTQQSVLEISEEAFRQPDPAFIRDMPSWVPLMVRSLTFSDDGFFMAAALTNQEVDLWLAEGTLMETIRCSTSNLVFLPQTQFLVLCREDGRIEVWATMPAHLLMAFENLPELAGVPLSHKKLSHCCLACSRDGTQLSVIATFSDIQSVHSHVFLYDLEQDNEYLQLVLQRTFAGPPDVISNVGYFPSDHSLSCSSYSGTLWEINTGTGAAKKLLPVETFWPRPCCSSISPDGSFVALADRYGMVLIWDISNQRIVLQFQAHKEVNDSIDAMSAMVWLPDGKRLITVGTSRAGDDQVKRSEKKKLPPSLKHSTIKIWRIEV